MIADEVATGFGRTGRMFAVDHDGVSPDLLTLGKGLTGGYLPLAATLATERIFRRFLGGIDRTFFHGHTYTGNPLGCAAALASLSLMPRVLRSLGPKMRMLGELGGRRCGMMVGIDMPDRPAALRVMRAARRRGALIRPLGNVVVVMPPPAISTRDLGRLIEIVKASIATA